MISAVVTSLNEEEFIGECLDSVFNQTVPVGEVILVDAGSWDNTLKIAGQYPVKIVQVGFFDVYLSKKTGIQQSKYDTILCLDGDTAISLNFVEVGLEHLGKGYNLVTGWISPVRPNPLGNFLAWWMNRNKDYLSGPAYLLRKQSYAQVCLLNGDVCLGQKELPLQQFQNTLKCSRMLIYTDLPSTSQKYIIGTAVLGSAAGLGYYAYRRWKRP